MKKTITAYIATLLTLALFVSATTLFTGCQNKELGTVEPLDSSGKGLSAQAMELPLAKELYLYRVEKGENPLDSGQEPAAFLQEATNPEAFTKLREANVLPNGPIKELSGYPFQPTGHFISLGWTPEEKETPDPDILKNYATYLGLEELSDWEQITQPDGVFKISGQYSPSAQLYLVLSEGVSYPAINLMVFSLSAQQMEDIRTGEGTKETLQVPLAQGTTEETPKYGQWQALTSGNSKGYYLNEVIANTWMNQAFYIDYSTAEQKPLCNITGCLHQSEACDSWFAYGDFETLYASENQLFWVFDQYSNFPDTGELFAHIDVTALDGTGRKRIVSLKEHQFIDGGYEGSIYTDGNYIAYSLTEANPETKQINRKIIIASIASGKTVKEYPLQGDDIANIIGINNGQILLNRSTSSLPYAEAQTDRTFVLCLLSMEDGSIQELQRGTYTTGEWQYIGYTMHSGKLYAQDKQNNIVEINTENNTAKTVFSVPNSWQNSSFTLQDQHLIIQTSEGEIVKEYAVPLSGGAPFEITLTRSFKGEYSHLWVLAEGPDLFLVQYNTRIVPLTLIGTGGAPYTIQQEQPIYGLISKEDYYNNLPNYQEILLPA